MNDDEENLESRQRELLAQLQNDLTESLLDLIYRLEYIEHFYGLTPAENMTRLKPLVLPEDVMAAMEDMRARLTILEAISGD